MWRNTLGLRGAVTTPTKLRQARQQLRRVGDHALRLVGLQLRLDAARARCGTTAAARSASCRRTGGSRARWGCGRRWCAGWRSGRAPPGRPSRCGWSPATARARRRATACASPPAGRRRCSVRPGSSAGSWRARRAWFHCTEQAIFACGSRSLWCNSAHMPTRFRHAALVGKYQAGGIRADARRDRAVPGRPGPARSRSSARRRCNTGIDRLSARSTPTELGAALRPRGRGRRRRHHARHRAPARAATACRWSASTRAGSASSPTSPLDELRRTRWRRCSPATTRKSTARCSKATCGATASASSKASR